MKKQIIFFSGIVHAMALWSGYVEDKKLYKLPDIYTLMLCFYPAGVEEWNKAEMNEYRAVKNFAELHMAGFLCTKSQIAQLIQKAVSEKCQSEYQQIQERVMQYLGHKIEPLQVQDVELSSEQRKNIERWLHITAAQNLIELHKRRQKKSKL